MLESAIGANHCLALATLPNIKYPNDVFPTDRFFARDLASPPMVHSTPGKFRAHDRPGIGVEPDEEMLSRLALAKDILG